LHSVFSILVKYNIAIKGKKCFIGYLSATVLGKKVDSFRMSITKEKLEAITKLAFPKTAKELETYLGIAGWLRDKVPFYIYISKPLQDRKTKLFKRAPTKGNPRKTFAAREAFAYPIGIERVVFVALQKALTTDTILVHANLERALFCNLDASK
jgi:hypothetical protein